MRPILLLIVFAIPAAAQEASGPPGPRIVLPREREVALARSAAPLSVSRGARLWVFDRGRYVVGDAPGPEARAVGGDVATIRADEPTGFFVIRAPNYYAAVAVARTCPHVRHGGVIVVRPGTT